MSFTRAGNNNDDLQRTQNAFESFHLLVSISALKFLLALFSIYTQLIQMCAAGAGPLTLIALQTNQDFLNQLIRTLVKRLFHCNLQMQHSLISKK